MAGFASHKATTNFEVRDLPLEPEMYARLLFESLADGGWVDRASGSDLEWTNDWAKEHAELAAAFPDETPLTIERGRVAVRTVF
jgi:hypothetical protein